VQADQFPITTEQGNVAGDNAPAIKQAESRQKNSDLLPRG
jgi:hypothetical protein